MSNQNDLHPLPVTHDTNTLTKTLLRYFVGRFNMLGDVSHSFFNHMNGCYLGVTICGEHAISQAKERSKEVDNHMIQVVTASKICWHKTSGVNKDMAVTIEACVTENRAPQKDLNHPWSARVWLFVKFQISNAYSVLNNICTSTLQTYTYCSWMRSFKMLHTRYLSWDLLADIKLLNTTTQIYHGFIIRDLWRR